MSVVYVVQAPRKSPGAKVPDLSSAAQYGGFKFVFESEDMVFASPLESVKKAHKILQNYNPEEDYILWPGLSDPAALYAVMIACQRIGITEYSFLYWSRPHNGNPGYYEPKRMEV